MVLPCSVQQCCDNRNHSFTLQHIVYVITTNGKCNISGHGPLATHTHTRLTALFLGLPVWAGTRKVKPIWILLKQETVSGSGISWAICKSAPCSRQITTPAPHHSVFYRPGALPAAQASKHWRPQLCQILTCFLQSVKGGYTLYKWWQRCNFVSYLCQLVFAAMLQVKL